MNVILLKDVENLGQLGDLVNVKRGFARNFLIPQGLASLAGPGQRKALAELVRQQEARNRKAKQSAVAMAEQYQDLSCTLTVQAGEDDKLFGSVGPRDIAAAITDLVVDHRQVLLEEPIKQLGVYSVPVRLHPEVQVTAKVWVVKA